jgi:hypothetical protein
MQQNGKIPKTLLKTWFIDNLGENEIWLNYICREDAKKWKTEKDWNLSSVFPWSINLWCFSTLQYRPWESACAKRCRTLVYVICSWWQRKVLQDSDWFQSIWFRDAKTSLGGLGSLTNCMSTLFCYTTSDLFACVWFRMRTWSNV